MSDTGNDTALTPDLAQKVLGADLRNIVKKAGDGATLSAEERRLVRQFLSNKSDPDELVETRRNSLIQNWASGKRLTAEEFAEIEPYLPKNQSAKAAASAESFELQAEASNSNQHYAEFYGESDRTIKRWRTKGRKAVPPDHPPYDDPTKMPEWYARHHKRRVPPSLLQIAADHAKTLPEEKTEPKSETDRYTRPNLPEGSGFQAELDRVREEARKAAGSLEAAEESGNQSAVDLAARRYDRASKMLREYERDAVKILASAGDLVPIGPLEEMLMQKHQTISSEIKSMVPRVVPLIEIEPTIERKVEVWQRELDSIFRKLAEGGFGDEELLELEVEDAA